MDDSGMGASYSSFRESRSTVKSTGDSFFDVDDFSTNTTGYRRQVLERSGVKVVVEPVVRERATSAKEIVRGRNATDRSLCFLKLDFDPNYEEVEEFQWNRKRRFDRLLVFGGKGADRVAAEADAFVKAVKHLKTMIAQRQTVL